MLFWAGYFCPGISVTLGPATVAAWSHPTAPFQVPWREGEREQLVHPPTGPEWGKAYPASCRSHSPTPAGGEGTCTVTLPAFQGKQGEILYRLESLNIVHVKGQIHKWMDCRWVLDPALLLWPKSQDLGAASDLTWCFTRREPRWAACSSAKHRKGLWLSQFSP